MKISQNLRIIRVALMAGLFTLTLAAASFAEDAPSEKTQVLLDKVKKAELDRQIAAKQTAVERLKEDLDKNKKDTETLQQTMATTATMIKDSTEHMDGLTAERKRLQHDLNLTLARIDAERQKMDGLRNLSAAQAKSLTALASHMDEGDARTRLRIAEMQMLSEGKLVPGDETDYKGHPELLKLHKALVISEAKTNSEEKTAREAMKAASAKVQAADLAAAKVQQMSEQADNPEPVAEKPVKSKAAHKTDAAETNN